MLFCKLEKHIPYLVYVGGLQKGLYCLHKEKLQGGKHMKFSTKLRELRKLKGFTQEELAEILSVSFQTVSKWENDVSMPDVGLLPVIAECFGVSIDELLDYNSAQRKNEKKEIAKEVHEKINAGNVKEAYDFLNNKIERYSSDVKLNHLLAATTYKLAQESDGEDKISYLQKAIQRAETTIKLDNGNTSKSAQAKMCIGYCLRELGLAEQAEEIAQSMPSMFSSREVMLSRILDGNRKVEQAQQNLEYLKELEEEMLSVIKAGNV